VPAIETITVRSWEELNSAVFADSLHEAIGRFRSPFAFRGHADAAADLRTSLARLGNEDPGIEGHLLRNFRKYAYRDAPPQGVDWDVLSLAQHHGLPTRLLDWTYSPFVALHFVTANLGTYDLDGAIWMVNYVDAHKRVPEPLRGALEHAGANVFTSEMLNTSTRSLAEFDQLAAGNDFVLFFEPPSLDDRIINQYALFSVLSNARADLGDWLADHPEYCRRIVIPRDLKWEFRDKLDQANITERVLFPGLDGLSRWLARHYTPRALDPSAGSSSAGPVQRS
jgi:hypothetical protein